MLRQILIGPPCTLARPRILAASTHRAAKKGCMAWRKQTHPTNRERSEPSQKKKDAETGPCLVNGGHDHAEQDIKKESQLRAVFCTRNSGCSWEPKETVKKTVPKVSLHMP